jgi:hypothetical protein
MINTVFIGLACAQGVFAYTSDNAPMRAGNANLPNSTGGGFSQMQTSHNLPEVNVKFSYPAADSIRILEGAENRGALDRRIDEALQQAREDQSLFQRVASALDGASSFLKSSSPSAFLAAKDSTVSDNLAEVIRGMGHVAGPNRPLQRFTSGGGASVCGREDYAAQCPMGFSPSGNGSCRATSAASCGGEYDFSQFNTAMKKQFAAACNTSFPCM